MLFKDARERAAFWERYAAPDALRTRARGWAVLFDVALLDTGLVDHPAHAAIGARALERVAAEA